MKDGPTELDVLAELLRRRDELQDQLRAVYAAIDTHRTKCPTCRCRLLPEEYCSCCAGSFPLGRDKTKP